MEKASPVLGNTQEALSNAFSAMDANKFFDEKIYGNLMKIDKRVVEKKKKLLTVGLPLVYNAVTWLLTKGVFKEEQEAFGYKYTKERASCLENWKEMILENPHLWPKGPIFAYLLDLKALLTAINSATGNSLTLKDANRFVEWSDPEKILLPTKMDSPHKFTCSLADAFPYACVMLEQSKLLIAEIASPPYYWQIDVATNIPKLAAGNGVDIPGFDGFIKEFAKEQVVKCYLSKLGVIEHTISLATAIAAGSRLVDGATAKGFLKILTTQSVTEKIFGKEAVRELRELEKEGGSYFNQKAYKDLTDEGKAEVRDQLGDQLDDDNVKKDPTD
jgi:hypothetical protein